MAPKLAKVAQNRLNPKLVQKKKTEVPETWETQIGVTMWEKNLELNQNEKASLIN
jgi:hypothetical protein